MRRRDAAGRVRADRLPPDLARSRRHHHRHRGGCRRIRHRRGRHPARIRPAGRWRSPSARRTGAETRWNVGHDRPDPGVARFDIPVPAGSRSLTLSPAGDGPVTVVSTTLERASPGVVYDSHGIVGTTVDVIGRAEPATLRWEIGERDPAAIVVVFGTNEGFDPDVDRASYAETFRARGAPAGGGGAGGGGDRRRAARRQPPARRLRPGGRDLLQPGRPGPTPATPPAAGTRRPAWTRCARPRPPSRRRRDGTSGTGRRSWAAPAASISGRRPSRPWPGTIHVHLRDEGYEASARALFAQLMGHYDAWRRGRGGIAALPAD